MNEWTCHCFLNPRNSVRIFAGEIKSCFTVSVSSCICSVIGTSVSKNAATCYNVALIQKEGQWWRWTGVVFQTCLDYLNERACMQCEPSVSEYDVPGIYSLIVLGYYK